MKPTYEQLEADNVILRQENAGLKKEVADLKQLVEQLLSRVADLESQLKKNSKNSSKPSSSDQKPNRPPIQKKNRSFHPGASRQLLPESEVTSRTQKCIDTCPKCSQAMKTTCKVMKWQQIELPVVKPLFHQ